MANQKFKKINPAIVVIAIFSLSLALVGSFVLFFGNSADNNKSAEAEITSKEEVAKILSSSSTGSLSFNSASLKYGNSTFESKNTVFENLINNPDFSQITNVMTSNNWETVLNSKEQITFLLVTDEVFSKTGGEDLTSLLNPENATQLERTMNAHIIPGIVKKEGLNDGQTLLTKSGDKLKISIVDGKYFLNDAEIISFDLPSRNGVIHIINSFQVLDKPEA